MSGWNTIDSSPENMLVMTKIDDSKGCRNEQTLHRNGRMWFGGDMYVYYQPTHWRELTQFEKLKLKNEAEAKAIRQMEESSRLLDLSN